MHAARPPSPHILLIEKKKKSENAKKNGLHAKRPYRPQFYTSQTVRINERCFGRPRGSGEPLVDRNDCLKGRHCFFFKGLTALLPHT